MLVLEIFNIKNHGTAVIFDQSLDLSDIKLNQVFLRISDNQKWIVAGIERWSHQKQPGAFLLKGDATISIGDDLVLVET